MGSDEIRMMCMDCEKVATHMSCGRTCCAGHCTSPTCMEKSPQKAEAVVFDPCLKCPECTGPDTCRCECHGYVENMDGLVPSAASVAVADRWLDARGFGDYLETDVDKALRG